MSAPFLPHSPITITRTCREEIDEAKLRKRRRSEGRIAYWLKHMPRQCADEIRLAICSERRGKGFPSQMDWELDTLRINAGGIYAAASVYKHIGGSPTGIASLAGLPALNALITKFDSGHWSAGYLCLQMNVVRKFHRILFGTTPALLSIRAS